MENLKQVVEQTLSELEQRELSSKSKGFLEVSERLEKLVERGLTKHRGNNLVTPTDQMSQDLSLGKYIFNRIAK
jgi:hypothetical protein